MRQVPGQQRDLAGPVRLRSCPLLFPRRCCLFFRVASSHHWSRGRQPQMSQAGGFQGEVRLHLLRKPFSILSLAVRGLHVPLQGSPPPAGPLSSPSSFHPLPAETGNTRPGRFWLCVQRRCPSGYLGFSSPPPSLHSGNQRKTAAWDGKRPRGNERDASSPARPRVPPGNRNAGGGIFLLAAAAAGSPAEAGLGSTSSSLARFTVTSLLPWRTPAHGPTPARAGAAAAALVSPATPGLAEWAPPPRPACCGRGGGRPERSREGGGEGRGRRRGGGVPSILAWEGGSQPAGQPASQRTEGSDGAVERGGGDSGSAEGPGSRPQERMGVCSQGRWALLSLLWETFLWAGVAAQPSTPAPNSQSTPGAPHAKLQFRLAGYPRKHNEGRIEVFYNQEWGTICDDDFSLANAHVLCRHLGFVGASGWTHSAKYGKGIGRIWLDNVNCGGSEKSITDCQSRGWGNSDCSHEEDAGVVCKDERIPGFVDSNVIETEQNQVEEVRLRPVVSHTKRPLPVAEGVVEVRHQNSWAQICDENWDGRNSRVICGMLGFPAEKKVNRNFYKLYAERQQHQLNYHLHSVSCTGDEVHLSLCSFEFYKGNTTRACKGGMPAVVSCVPGPLFAANSNTQGKKKRRQQLREGQRVRLKGGAKPGEGRVEVLKNGEWGTVCDDRWNLVSASVVCRELGFGSAKEALTGARMGQGMGQIHMNEVQCVGTEKSLWSCPHKNITQEGCKHSEDAAVRCNIPYMGYESMIRLSGGRSRFEGRVELALGAGSHSTRRWGLICGDGWGTLEAMVACRQLGLGFANHGLQETWYWDASNVTEMVLSGVKCSGNEMALAHCQHHPTVNCRRTGTRFAAGVICSETASDLLLHAPLVQETAYIEDRPLHMLYCAAEENCLSSSARNANWPYGHRRLLRFSSQIHNNGRADFRPKAGRHSWVWHECHGHYHSMDVFTHYDLLTPNGTKVAEGHKASFCLEDTECEEDVGKRYECANFGEQGITVGCWDLYRHDIDCQWIDITDVKAGNYILQVVINPRYEVAESDFTNNAMKCNCKYDGHRIWVHNCHIGDALSKEANRRFEQYPGQLNNQIV